MPNARDMWVLLKAQDQATRALNSYSRAVREAGNATRIAQLESQRGAIQQALAANQLAQSAERAGVAEQALLQAQARRNITQANLNGTNQAYINTQRQAIIDAQNQINTHREAINTLERQNLAYRQNISAINQQITALKQADVAAAAHARDMEALSNNLRSASQTAYAMGFALSVAGLAGAVGIAGAVKAMTEYDRQVRLTATQVAGMGDHLQELSDIGKRVAKTIGVSFQSIQPALYDIFSSMDVSITDAEKDLTLFAKAAVAGQTDIQSVSRGTIGILNTFKLGAQDLNHVLDLQFKFIQKGVGTYDEWAKKIGLVSPSAIRAGQSLEVMIASLAEASRMSGVASRAGTAVARAFDAFSNPNAIAKLKALGVNVADAQGNFRNFIDVMFDFRAALEKIPGGQADKVKAIFEVFKGAGGTIEARRFLQALLLQKGTLEDLAAIYKDTANAAGSLDQAYGVMANSISAKTERLKNNWQLLKIAIGEALTPTILKVIDLVQKLFDWFNNLSPKAQQLAAYFLLIATALAAIGGPMLLFVGLLANIAASFVIAGSSIVLIVGGLTLLVGGVLAAGAAFVVAYKKIYGFRDAVRETYFWIHSTADKIGKAWMDNIQPALDKTWDILKNKVAPAFKDFMETVRDKVMPEVRKAFQWIQDNANPTAEKLGKIIKEQINPALEDMANWWKENKSWVEPLIGEIADITGNLVILLGVLSKFGAIGGLEALAIQLQGVAAVWDLLGKAIKGATEKTDAFPKAALGIIQIGFWLDVVRGKFQVINDAANTFVKALFGIWELEAVLTWLKEMADKIREAWDRLKKWFDDNSLNNAIAGAFTVIKTTIEGILNAIVGVFQTFFGNMGNTASGGMGNLLGTILGGLGNIRVNWSAVWSGILGATVGILGQIVGSVGSHMSDIVGRVASAMFGIPGIIIGAFARAGAGAAAEIGHLISVCVGAAGQILGAFAGIAGQMYGIGSSIMRGLASGIGGSIGAAAAAAAQAVAATVSSARNIIQARSPSRVFMAIGRDAMEGLAIGLSRNANLAVNAVNNMSRQYTNATVAPFDAVTSGRTQTYNEAKGSGANQTINIYTQEIDPRVHAEELGWRLVNRVGI